MRRTAAAAKSEDDEAARWQNHAVEQRRIVGCAAAPLTKLAQQLASMGATSASQVATLPEHTRKPLRDVAEAYVLVAATSTLVQTARAKLARAEQLGKLAPVEMMDRILADVMNRVASLGTMDRGESKWVRDPMKLRLLEQKLRKKLLALRGRILAGDPNVANELQTVYEQVSTLQFDAEVSLNFVALTQIGALLNNLHNNNWVWVTERVADAALCIGTAGQSRRRGVTQLLAESRRFNSKIDRIRDLWIYGDEGERKQAKQLFAGLTADPQFRSFFQRVHDLTGHVATRVKVIKIAAMIATIAGGEVAADAALGLGFGAAGEFIGTVIGEATTATLLETSMFKSNPGFRSLMSAIVSNAVLFGSLRGVASGFQKRFAGNIAELEAAGDLKAAGRMGTIATGLSMTAEAATIVVISATEKARKKREATGEPFTFGELGDVALNSLVMFVGTSIMGRVLSEPMARLRGGTRLGALNARVLRMARNVKRQPTREAALELLGEYRTLLEKQAAALDAIAARADGDPRAIRRAGMTPEQLTRGRNFLAQQLHGQSQFEVLLNLREIAPGVHYAVDEKRMPRVLEILHGEGAFIEAVPSDGLTSFGRSYMVTTEAGARIKLSAQREPAAEPNTPTSTALARRGPQSVSVRRKKILGIIGAMRQNRGGTYEVGASTVARLRHKLRRLGARPGEIHYEPKTNAPRFELQHPGGATIIVRGRLERPLFKAAAIANQRHRIVGKPVNIDTGMDILGRLADGDLSALSGIGAEVPTGKHAGKLAGVEWGLGAIGDRYVIVRGAMGHVDWSRVPGVEFEVHTHPRTKDRYRRGWTWPSTSAFKSVTSCNARSTPACCSRACIPRASGSTTTAERWSSPASPAAPLPLSTRTPAGGQSLSAPTPRRRSFHSSHKPHARSASASPP